MIVLIYARGRSLNAVHDTAADREGYRIDPRAWCNRRDVGNDKPGSQIIRHRVPTEPELTPQTPVRANARTHIGALGRMRVARHPVSCAIISVTRSSPERSRVER